MSGQVKVSNREIKSILTKTVNATRTDWVRKLDDALWAYRTAFKTLIEEAGTSRVTELHQLHEFCYQIFESARIYKEGMKMMHDKNIIEQNSKPRDMVLLYNSRFRLFPGKLELRWSETFRVIETHPTRAVEITSEDGARKFKVNG
nr:uncharacterized protein LOC117276425 [Nicotiana tomentosiformis]